MAGGASSGVLWVSLRMAIWTSWKWGSSTTRSLSASGNCESSDNAAIPDGPLTVRHARLRRFKPIFVTIYPFHIFLDTRSPPPSHALLRCAVLYYTWRAVPPNTINFDAADAKELERLVEYNVGLTSMVEPDEEAILALVILSQTCIRENPKFLKVEDPFGAGAAAHRMSVTIGLEESIERCAQEPVEYMSESWNRPMIDRVCLVGQIPCDLMPVLAR